MALTFAIGLIAAKLWAAPQAQSPEPKNTSEIQSSAQTPRFTGGEFRSGFHDHYFSPDGAHIMYGCFEHNSLSQAAYWLREEVGATRAVERAPKLDNKGKAIGRRVVVRRPSDAEPDAASIFWTEHTRLFTIRAPSLKYALEFEEWMAAQEYRPRYCYNFSHAPSSNARPRRRTTH
jgi:hypothetical protein